MNDWMNWVNEWMKEWMNGVNNWIHDWMNEWAKNWMNVWMKVVKKWMFEWMNEWGEQVDPWANGRMNGMNKWMNEWMDDWMWWINGWMGEWLGWICGWISGWVNERANEQHLLSAPLPRSLRLYILYVRRLTSAIPFLTGKVTFIIRASSGGRLHRTVDSGCFCVGLVIVLQRETAVRCALHHQPNICVYR